MRPTAAELGRELGLLRWRDWGPLGISRGEVRYTFIEIAPGVFGPRDTDATTIAAKRVPQGVLCLHSALYFHGLRDEPPEVWMAIGEKARKPRIVRPHVRTVRFSGRALEEGVEHRHMFQVPVRVYSIAKTVADLFKYRHKLGHLPALFALHDALRSGRCTPADLRYHAALCRVSRTLEPWLQALEAEGGVLEPRELYALAASRESPADRIPRMPWIREVIPFNPPGRRSWTPGWVP